MKDSEERTRSRLQSHLCRNPSTSSTARFTAKGGKERTKTGGRLSMRNGELRKAFSKDVAWTRWLLAGEFTNVQKKQNGLPADWQIAYYSSIATVNTAGRGLTNRAGCGGRRSFTFELDGLF